jgi:hypothetical protein
MVSMVVRSCLVVYREKSGMNQPTGLVLGASLIA